MNKVLFIILLALISVSGYSQYPETLLSSVEMNNPEIKASRKWLESELARSKTGIYPENPEIAYNYLWGSPGSYGNQQEFEVTQRLRFPGYYTSISSMQERQYQQYEVLAARVKADVLYRAKNEIATLTWLTKKEKILAGRLKESGELVSMMQQGFERQEFSRPALDKARLYHLNNQSEMEKTKAELAASMQTLLQLNGMQPLNFQFTGFVGLPVLPPADSLVPLLLENNPDIRMARINMEVTRLKVKVEKMDRLPVIEAGYKGETILDQKLKGIHTGLSIPLWENRNRVKQAAIESEWTQLNHDQVVSEITTAFNVLYSGIQSVLNNYMNIKELAIDPSLSESTIQLLKAGQISLPDFFIEMQMIHETQLNFLEIEKEYCLLHNRLNLLMGL
ncbi:MAG: TolC family protein [Bacteroidales bacterium]